MGGRVANTAKKVKGLTGIQKALLVIYSLYADDNNPTKSVFPSLSTLVEDLDFSRSTIHEARKVLQEKGFLILIKIGCSKTRKSNEYLLNPELFKPIVKITCEKLLPGSVYNPVNNSVDNSSTVPIAGRDYSGSRTGAIPGAGPQSSSSSFIELNHMIGGQQDDFLQKDVDIKMQALGIFDKERKLLISQYGVQAINLELRDLSERRGIENKGAYLRKVLEQKYGRLMRYKRAAGY